MKILACDPCKKEDNVVTETNGYLKVKGKSFLRLDVCPKHSAIVKKLSMVDYVRYVFNLNGVKLSETDAEIKLKYLS